MFRKHGSDCGGGMGGGDREEPLQSAESGGDGGGGNEVGAGWGGVGLVLLPDLLFHSVAGEGGRGSIVHFFSP